MQPGDTIKPNDKTDDKAVELDIPHPVETEIAAKSETQSESITEQATPQEEQQLTEELDSPASEDTNSGREYSSDSEPAPESHASPDPVSWTASEFVDHEKNSAWFMKLAGISLVLVVIVYLVTREFITSFAIILAVALFGVTATRKPRTLQYTLDSTGINIGGKPYPYDTFKSFAVIAEDAFSSIQLVSQKRFMPPISLYYPPEQEDQIITTLGSYLPHEEQSHDPVDRLMRKVRF